MHFMHHIYTGNCAANTALDKNGTQIADLAFINTQLLYKMSVRNAENAPQYSLFLTSPYCYFCKD